MQLESEVRHNQLVGTKFVCLPLRLTKCKFAEPVNPRESRQRNKCYYPVAKTTASASFLSVESRCLTEKINPLLGTRPQQNTGIHDECEVRYRVFSARVCL